MDILYTISIVAIIHGLFLAGLLFSYRKGNARANRVLGLFMIAFSAILSYTVVYGTPLVFLCFPFFYALGPLFYFYVKLLTRPAMELKKQDLVHGIPFLLVLSYMVFLVAGGYYEYIESAGAGTSVITILYWASILVLVQVHVAVYLFFTWRLIREHRRRISDYFSTVDLINLSWLRYFIFSLVAVIVAATVLTVILPRFGFPDRVGDMGAALVISLFIFAMGYRGLIQPELFTGTPEIPETVEKYKKSPLNREQGEEHVREMYRLMDEEELYTDPDLTLDMIAERVSASRHLLSRILNEIAGMNFYDFVNRYRVERVKSDLQDEIAKGRSILELAYDAGFNSKSTFNAAFRKHTGMTPTEYRKSLSAGDQIIP